MRPETRGGLAVALVLALAACQGEQKPAGKAAAGGEILPGSASDAMLPLDTLRSQPPLAPKPSATARAPGQKDAGGDAGESEAAPAAEAAAPETPAEPAAAQ